ncbi:CYFA0S17e01024g1_1 [Cyberlindnera fabianii]|uniref:CYFA0S17e01024g1_1 n=1 Tax=Cyberlindnera fabianii TaxID=36022 RepID=A0A061B7C4_CYBFA|nr:CYFA0S17e01024g1_1 [Cyberlindnera fabianii]
MTSERQPLLPQHENAPHLGTLAVMSLIINKMIGTGIFSTPSLIFSLCGSIGTTLVLWIIGALVCFCGLSIYIEFGLELPFSGGEKNYLQRVYRNPKGLAESVYAFQIVILGFSSGNAYAFGRYVLFAFGFGENDWIARWVGVMVITAVTYLHIYQPYHGTTVFTALGIIKILILALIIILGFLVAVGAIAIDGDASDNFKDIWRPYDGFHGNTYNISVALLQIIYSFKGWENANYVISEVKNPHHTLQTAAPLSVAVTAFFYLLVILSYYVVIPYSELKDSGVLIAGIFFRKIFGDTFSSRILPLLISLSNLGNVLAVFFSHARINQELAKEEIIPYSSTFSKLKNSLLLHWVVTVLVLLLPPNGGVYEFVVNLYAYPGTWINVLVAAGLLYLHRHSASEKWGLEKGENSWHTHWTACVVFLAANLFLALFPFVPPPPGTHDETLPYYIFPATGCAVLGAGVIYWYSRWKRASITS